MISSNVNIVRKNLGVFIGKSMRNCVIKNLHLKNSVIVNIVIWIVKGELSVVISVYVKSTFMTLEDIYLPARKDTGDVNVNSEYCISIYIWEGGWLSPLFVIRF